MKRWGFMSTFCCCHANADEEMNIFPLFNPLKVRQIKLGHNETKQQNPS